MCDLLKVCRVCLEPEKIVKLSPIFNETNKNKIALEIFLISGVHIDELQSKIPALICKGCSLDLSQAIRFRDLCTKSDIYFKKIISELELELIDWEVHDLKLEQEFSSTIQTSINDIDFKNSSSNHILETDHKLNETIFFKAKKKSLLCSSRKITKCILPKTKTRHNCDVCDKTFTTTGSMENHRRVKHELIGLADLFTCDICGHAFKLKYYLTRHIRVVHLKTLVFTKSMFPCQICGKSIARSRMLVHERSHKVLKPEDYFYCDMCGNKFKNLSELKFHTIMNHIRKVRFSCEICEKSYGKLSLLTKHVQTIHYNIRPHKCLHSGCDKAFSEKAKLTIHTRIHTGERPFECKLCEKTFIHKTDLRRHVWGHTGERPQKCSCGKGFFKKRELLVHKNQCKKK